MNYLQLVQRLRQECDIPGSGPSTTIGQTGEMKRLCDWINQAWVEIQEYRPDWEWMRKDMSFNTVNGTNTYSPTTIGLTDFASWRTDSFRIYYTATGIANQIILQQFEYNTFRDYYLLGARTITYARPVAIAQAPNKSLVLGLVPNDVYTVSGEYFSVPVEFTADADIPAMPTRWHMAIVYKAMMKYAMFESAPEVYQQADALYSAMINRVETDQTQTIIVAPALI